MHGNATGHSREDIVKQVEAKESSVHEYASYIPIGNAVTKVKRWRKEVAEIFYLTSRTKPAEIENIKSILEKYRFPKGVLLSRKNGEEYKDIAERIRPDILIEDDCESIGGADKMTITHVREEMRKKIISVVVQEFGGIDGLPDKVSELVKT